jgi:hypothetical protein
MRRTVWIKRIVLRDCPTVRRYDPKRARRSPAFPTYNSTPSASYIRYTPGSRGIVRKNASPRRSTRGWGAGISLS